MANTEQNFFRFIELIEGDSAESLTLKLRAIPFTYHLNQVWSDGKKHYALVNAQKKFPERLKEKLSQL